MPSTARMVEKAPALLTAPARMITRTPATMPASWSRLPASTGSLAQNAGLGRTAPGPGTASPEVMPDLYHTSPSIIRRVIPSKEALARGSGAAENGVTYASDLSSSRPAQTANCHSSTQIATSRTKAPVSPLTSASQQMAFAAFRACSATDGRAVSGSVSASRRSSANTRVDGLVLATACSPPSNDESSPARYCWVISPAAPAIETTTAGGESLREQHHAAVHPSRPQAGECLFGSRHLKGLDGRLDGRGRDQ